MKAIVFAGGAGTRLWPLSRKKSPKQLEKIIGDKSTLQLAVDRLLPDFSFNDIYISTNILYQEIVKEQLPDIPENNFIFKKFLKLPVDLSTKIKIKLFLSPRSRAIQVSIWVISI